MYYLLYNEWISLATLWPGPKALFPRVLVSLHPWGSRMSHPSNPEGSFSCAAASNSSNPLFFYFLFHRGHSRRLGADDFIASWSHLLRGGTVLNRGAYARPLCGLATLAPVDPVRPPPLPPFATFKHAHHLRTSRLEPALLLLCLSSRYQSVIVPCPRKSTPQGLSCVESAPTLARHCNAWNGRAVTIMAALHSTRP